jgi:ubiquinone/menaquinone biosynthesis C-methylase UbiE
MQMKSFPGWQYNDMKQVGTDYNDIKQVHEYDKQMQKLRDFRKENETILKTLYLTPYQTLIEFGTGTGNFAIEAARYCKKVFAIDVSPRMLECAYKKADKNGIKNIEFHNAGFLTYEHCAEPVDAVVSQLALHHLPDFWKLIALKRIHQLLQNGGIFYLGDVVFSFPIEEYDYKIDNWIDTMKQNVGLDFAKEAQMHIKEEYSTFDWILEEMLHKSGFKFNIRHKDDFFAVYFCSKEK